MVILRKNGFNYGVHHLPNEELKKERKEFFFNNDGIIFLLCLILEVFKVKGYYNRISLKTLTELDFLKDEKLIEEILDSYSFLEEWIFETIIEFSEDFGFFKVQAVKFINPSDTIKLQLKHFLEEIKGKRRDENELLEEYENKINDLNELIINLKNEQNKIGTFRVEYDFPFEDYDYKEEKGFLFSSAYEQFEFLLSFLDKKTKQFEKELNQYIKQNFKEAYFKQIEAFNKFLSECRFINGIVRIPCEIFADQKFEIIKILKYLEINNEIKVKSWLLDKNKQYWEIELLSQELLGLFIPNINISLEDKNKNKPINIKLDLNAKKLILNKDIINIAQSAHQFDLLKILFEEKPIDLDLDYAEIASLLDSAYFDQSASKQKALKKRYSDATYQLNQKVERETKGEIKSFLKSNLGLVRFNPEYTLNFK